MPDAAADLFCAGQAVLADGRILVVGGTSTTAGSGVKNITAFNWQSRDLERTGADEIRTLVRDRHDALRRQGARHLGLRQIRTDLVTVPELYSPATNTWQSLTAASHSMPIYPFIYQLPDGRIAHLGGSEVPTASEVLDLPTNQWTTIDSRVIDGGSIANYAPGRFIKAGSAADDGFSGNSLNTAFTLNMNPPGATWQPTANMAFPRSFLNLTNLPDGTVLATGGGTDKSGFNDANGVLQAEDWNPSTRILDDLRVDDRARASTTRSRCCCPTAGSTSRAAAVIPASPTSAAPRSSRRRTCSRGRARRSPRRRPPWSTARSAFIGTPDARLDQRACP